MSEAVPVRAYVQLSYVVHSPGWVVVYHIPCSCAYQVAGGVWPPTRRYMQPPLSLRARATGYVPDRSLDQAATLSPSFILPQLMLQVRPRSNGVL